MICSPWCHRVGPWRCVASSAKRAPGGQPLGLDNVAFVVRKDEVAAAAMDIDVKVQMLNSYDRAFDVPTGPAEPPRPGPGRFAGRGGRPENKVERIPFVGIISMVATLDGDWEHLIAWRVDQLAVLGPFAGHG
jgi:hypothetical protein